MAPAGGICFPPGTCCSSSNYFFISLSPNFQTLKFSSHFFQELWGLEDWNLVHMWIVDRYIVYTWISLLLLIHPFISSFFFLSNFQTFKFFITFFSETVWPRRLKLGAYMDSGQMYRLYQNQAAAAYSSLYFSFFFLSNFQTFKFLSHFSQKLCDLEGWNLAHTWTIGRCIVYTRISLLLLIHPFISSFFFLSNFQTLTFSSHFSQELWGLEGWNLAHTWTVGRCIVYTRIRLLLLIHPFIFHISFSPIFKH